MDAGTAFRLVKEGGGVDARTVVLLLLLQRELS